MSNLKDFLTTVAIASVILAGVGYVFINDFKYNVLCKQEGYEGGFVDMLGEPYCIHKTKSGRTIEVQYKGIMKDKGL